MRATRLNKGFIRRHRRRLANYAFRACDMTPSRGPDPFPRALEAGLSFLLITLVALTFGPYVAGVAP